MPAYVNDHWTGGSRPPSQTEFHVSAPAQRDDADDVFEKADRATRYAARQYAKHVDNVQQTNLDERDKHSAASAFGSTEAAKAADERIEAAEQERDRLRDEAQKVRDSIAPASDTASQLQAQRVWERARHALDAAQKNAPAKTVATARNIVRDAKPEELPTLAEELKPYLAAEELPTDWLDGEIIRAAPEYAAAKQAHADADRRVIKLRHNAAVVRRAYEAGKPVDERFLIEPS
jgi:hypothetical protein